MSTALTPLVPSTRTRSRRRDPAPVTRLQMHLTSRDHHCVLTMSGPLNARSSAAVDARHDELVRAGFDDVVLDCTDLQGIDESGAVALAQLWARLRSSGVMCRVRGLHPVLGDSPLELLLVVRSSGAQALTGILGPASPTI